METGFPTTAYLWATVISATRLSPSIIRIRLGGDDICRFQSNGVSDEFIWVVFPDRAGVVGNEETLPGRYYTVRAWDDRLKEMTIDFVVHEHGVATGWAQQAAPGDRIGLLRPRSCFEPPRDARWILLVADVTGLPAVGRIVEEGGEGQRIVAHVEIPLAGDRQSWTSAADVTVNWHESTGPGADATRLPAIAQTIERLPEGSGYIFIAGETKAVRDCRRHFSRTLGFDRRRVTSVGYWMAGKARE